MRVALLHGPVSDDDWAKNESSWTSALSVSAWEGDACVGHAGAFRFDTVVPGGRTLATAGVTRVGVRPTHRRRGILSALMTDLLTQARDEGRPLATLRASEGVIYGRFGYGIAGESNAVEVLCRRALPMRGAADGSLRILPRSELLTTVPALYATLIAGRVGAITRDAWYHQRQLGDALEGDTASFVVVHSNADGTDDGFAYYTVKWKESTFEEPTAECELFDLWGSTPAVELALWQYLTSLDLIDTIVCEGRPLDEAVRHAVADPRSVVAKVRYDEQWVRLVDVESALSARSYNDGSAVAIAVTDPMFPANTGTYVVDPAAGCRRADPSPADLDVDIGTLGALYMGSIPWAEMAAASRVRGPASAIAAADRLFAHRPLAWCGTHF